MLGTRSALRVPALVGMIVLVSAACGESTAPPQAKPTGTPEEEMMMQPGAEDMHVQILSPRAGFVLTANTLDVKVKTSGYTDSCDWAGKPDKEGVGHFHILLDGSLIDMFCTPTAGVSMLGVQPGQHMLEVVPAQDDHAEVLENEEEIAFTYRPKNPLPEVTPVATTGQPAVTMLEPQDGVTLSGTFAVKVEFSNFTPSCGLMGKPDVPGYGHWHVNIDSMTGPMMGMGTMLGMSCSGTFTGTTVGLKPGSTHTLFALLTDNGHAPIDVFDSITFTVGQ